MVCHPHLFPQSPTDTMVCHPYVLPQSSTSSSSIRPINLQPTANEASHRIYRPTIPTNWSLNLLTQTIDLPQTTHIQPLQPRNGPPFVVGLIKLMATDNPPCPPYPQTSNRGRARAPSSDHPHATSTTQKRHPIWIGSHPAHGPSTMSVGNTPNPACLNRPKGI